VLPHKELADGAVLPPWSAKAYTITARWKNAW
jgi:hypothetical protein